MAKSVTEKIQAKRERIAKLEAFIIEKQAEIKTLYQEIEELGVLEIRGVLNEVNMPLEDFLAAMRDNLLPQKKEVTDESPEAATK